MRMISIGGMLCAAAMTLCSMTVDGGDDLAGSGGGATQDDPAPEPETQAEGVESGDASESNQVEDAGESGVDGEGTAAEDAGDGSEG